MLNLYTTTSTKSKRVGSILSVQEKLSIKYHDLFDYPLSFSELIRWKVGKVIAMNISDTRVAKKNNYYFLEGRAGLAYKKLLRKRISAKKKQIAVRSAQILSYLPFIKMIAITGSLAMENSTDESDIDLMIVTKKGTLWTSRVITYFLLHATGYLLRKPRVKNERDALCLNMWLDESDLVWSPKNRNLYTAHEIAQIVPLVNKDHTFEKFLYKNKWILNFWPNAARVKNLQSYKVIKVNKIFSVTMSLCNYLTSKIEQLAYLVQYRYMKSKITREVISPTRAFFHPQDWGEVVLKRLN